MASTTDQLPPLIQQIIVDSRSLVESFAKAYGSAAQVAKDKTIPLNVRLNANEIKGQVAALPGQLTGVLDKLSETVAVAITGNTSAAKSARSKLFGENRELIKDLAAENGVGYAEMQRQVKAYYDYVKHQAASVPKGTGMAGVLSGVGEMRGAVEARSPGVSDMLASAQTAFKDLLRGANIVKHEMEQLVKDSVAMATSTMQGAESVLAAAKTMAGASSQEMKLFREQTRALEAQAKAAIAASIAVKASLDKARAEMTASMQQTTTTIAAMGKIRAAELALQKEEARGITSVGSDRARAALQQARAEAAALLDEQKTQNKIRAAQDVSDIKQAAKDADVARAQSNRAAVNAMMVYGAAVRAAQKRIDEQAMQQIKQDNKDIDAVRKIDTEQIVTGIRLSADKVKIIDKEASQKRVNDARQAGQQLLQTDRQVGNERLAVQKGEQARSTAETQAAEAIRIGNARRHNSEELVGARAHAQRMTDAIRFGYKNITLAMQSAWQNHHAKLKSSLKEDEIAVKGSMDRQTAMVRAGSAERQAELMSKSQAGVLGFATGQSNLAMNVGMIAGGAGIGAGILSSLDAFGQVEKGMASMEVMLKRTGIASEEVTRQMEALKTKAVELGNDLSLPGVSAADAVTAMNALVMAGFSVQEAMDSGRSVMQLAKAQNLDFADSARTVGATLNAFKIEAENATEVVDLFTAAQFASGGAGFDELRQGAQQASASFSAMFRETLGGKGALLEMDAALALLSKNMLRGSDAGTSLKTMLTRLSGATDETREMSKDLAASVGGSGNLMMDASGRARTLQESFNMLRQAMLPLSEIAKQELIGKLFGSDSARAAQIFLGTTNDELDQLKASLVDSAGLTTTLLEAQSKGWEGAKDALASFLDTMKLLSGERIAPFATAALTGFTKGLQFLAQDPSLQVVRDMMRGVGLALGAVLAAKGAVQVLGLAGSALKAIVLANPAVAVITLLGSALYAAYENIEPFREAVDKLASSVRADLSGRIEAVTVSLKKFTDQLKATAEVGAVLRSAQGGFGGLHLAITGISAAVQIAKDNMGLIDTVFERIGNRDFSGARDSFVLLAQEIAKPIMPVIGFAATAFASGFETAKIIAATKFEEIKTAIEGKLKSINWGEVWNAAFDSVSGAVGTLQDAAGKIVGVIGGVIGEAIGPVIGKVGEFLGAHVGDILGGLFNFASKIGEFLAKTIFSEQFIKAVAAAGATLAILAGDLALGFIKGFVTQLWEQKGAVHKAIHDIVVFAFTGLRDLADDNPFLAVLAAPAIFFAITKLKTALFGIGTGFKANVSTKLENAMTETSIKFTAAGEKITSAGIKISDGLTKLAPDSLRSKMTGVGDIVERTTTRVGTSATLLGDFFEKASQRIRSHVDEIATGLALGMAAGLAAFNAQISDDLTTKVISYATAIGSVVTAFATGGPIAGGFAAAMVIVGSVLGKAKEEQDKLNESTETWRQILAVTDVVKRNVQVTEEFAKAITGGDDGLKNLAVRFDEVGISSSKFVVAVSEGSDEVGRMREALIDAALKAPSMDAQIDGLTMSVQEYAAAQGMSTEEARAFAAQSDSDVVTFDRYTKARQDAAEANAVAAGVTKEAYKAEQEAAEQSERDATLIQRTQQAISDATAGAATKFDELRSSIDAARRKYLEPWELTIFDPIKAKADMISAVDSLGAAIKPAMEKGLSIANILAGDFSGPEGARAFEAIRSFTTSFTEQNAAIAEGAGSYDEYIANVTTLREKTIEAATAQGLNHDEIENLLFTMQLSEPRWRAFGDAVDSTKAKVALWGETNGIAADKIVQVQLALEDLKPKLKDGSVADLTLDIKGMARQFGLSNEQVIALVDSLDTIPAEKKAEIKASLIGKERTEAELAELARGRQTDIVVRTIIDEATARAAEARLRLLRAQLGGGFLASGIGLGAEGGIYTRPTSMLIGEEGEEALIPLTKPRRALELLQRSGLMDFALTAAAAGAVSRRPQGDLNTAAYGNAHERASSPVPSLAVTAPQASGPVIGELHVHSNAVDEYAVGMVVASRISGIANRVRV